MNLKSDRRNRNGSNEGLIEVQVFAETVAETGRVSERRCRRPLP